jgi:SAM-dependent methyltransferase
VRAGRSGRKEAGLRNTLCRQVPKQPQTSQERAQHWDAAYEGRGARGVSWYQELPRVSLALIEALGVGPEAALIDVGGGASPLAQHLLERGFQDLTVLDLSAGALAEARLRVGEDAPVEWLHEDLLGWQPSRLFDVWHDRAVLQFFVREDERERYLARLRAALRPGGSVVIATFAPDGPEVCSGLPVARYSSDDLAGLLGPELELVETRREEHTTPRGAVQPFTWVAGRWQGRPAASRPTAWQTTDIHTASQASAWSSCTPGVPGVLPGVDARAPR